MRKTVSELLTQPYYLGRNLNGRGEPSVEDFTIRTDALAGRSIDQTKKNFEAYRKAGGEKSYTEFQDAVGRAMRRQDVSVEGDEFIDKTAKAWRESLDEMKLEAINVGRLPKEIKAKFADSYLHRMWNKPKLIAQEPKFKNEKLRLWAERKVAEAEQNLIKSTDRRKSNISREIEELQIAKLRREEELKQRSQNEAGDLEGLNEKDILEAVREVRNANIKEPETLTSFIRRAGGVYGPDGEIAAIGINNRNAPAFLRKTRRTITDKAGGWDLDTLTRMAWEEGFLRSKERPDITELLDALRDDFNKTRRIVREGDEALAARLGNITEIEAALHRLGVDVDSPRFGTSADVKNLVAKVTKEVNAKADARIKDLEARLVEIENDAARQADEFFEDGIRKEATDEIIDHVFANLVGRAKDGVVPDFNISPKARGPLKNKVLDIHDLEVEDYLESNIEAVGRRYLRLMGAEVELTRKFGSSDMEAVFNKISEDYNRLRKFAKSEKELKLLDNRERADLKEIKAARDILRGQYGVDCSARCNTKCIYE